MSRLVMLSLQGFAIGRRFRRSRLLVFGLVGATTAVVYVGTVAVLNQMGVSPSGAATAGSIVAVMYSYTLHSHITFSTKVADALAIAKYVAVAGMSSVLNGIVVWVLGNFIAYVLLTQVVSICIIVPISYTLLRLWVFRPT